MTHKRPSPAKKVELPLVGVRPEDESAYEPVPDSEPRERKSLPDGDTQTLQVPQKIGGAEGM